MAISSMSTTKQAPSHLVPNYSPLKQHLPSDPLLLLDHELMPLLTDPTILVQAMDQDQTVPHPGDETMIAGTM
jgi:hypothetical protein